MVHGVNKFFDNIEASAERYNIPHEIFRSADAIRSRLPQFAVSGTERSTTWEGADAKSARRYFPSAWCFSLRSPSQKGRTRAPPRARHIPLPRRRASASWRLFPWFTLIPPFGDHALGGHVVESHAFAAFCEAACRHIAIACDSRPGRSEIDQCPRALRELGISLPKPPAMYGYRSTIIIAGPGALISCAPIAACLVSPRRTLRSKRAWDPFHRSIASAAIFAHSRIRRNGALRKGGGYLFLEACIRTQLRSAEDCGAVLKAKK
jgi:hypothetical protein